MTYHTVDSRHSRGFVAWHNLIKTTYKFLNLVPIPARSGILLRDVDEKITLAYVSYLFDEFTRRDMTITSEHYNAAYISGEEFRIPGNSSLEQWKNWLSESHQMFVPIREIGLVPVSEYHTIDEVAQVWHDFASTIENGKYASDYYDTMNITRGTAQLHIDFVCQLLVSRYGHIGGAIAESIKKRESGIIPAGRFDEIRNIDYLDTLMTYYYEKYALIRSGGDEITPSDLEMSAKMVASLLRTLHRHTVRFTYVDGPYHKVVQDFGTPLDIILSDATDSNPVMDSCRWMMINRNP